MSVKRGTPLFEERGQMVVELCVVMPVVLMVAVIIIDGLVFAAASSKFGHLAAQAVLCAAASPSGVDFDSTAVASQIEEQLATEMNDSQVEVEVSASTSGRICEFACEMSMVPWPLSQGGGSVMGIGVPARLKYVSKLSVRPYEIGALW